MVRDKMARELTFVSNFINRVHTGTALKKVFLIQYYTTSQNYIIEFMSDITWGFP